MSLDALPYMAFLLAVEFTAGTLLVTWALHLRGLVTRGFVELGAATALVGAALSLWIGLSLAGDASPGGYLLDGGLLTPARVATAVLLVLCAAYTWLVWREPRPVAVREKSRAFGGSVPGSTGTVVVSRQVRPELPVGGAGSLAALAVVALTAGVFRLPAWSYAGVFLSLLLGALNLGAVTMGMVLGHWYLVTPRLPEQPLNEATLGLLAVLVAQAVLVIINLAIPAHQPPSPGAGGALAQNPAFWLRLGVGLVFPIVLALMAWRSSVERGMMSATGLLYIATGAVLAGEALARGLQLATAIPF